MTTLQTARPLFAGFTLAALAFSPFASAAGVDNPARPDGKPHAFTFGGAEFLLDGKPFQLRGGELHPQRIPKPYWRHRIQMAKSAGLNSITIYTMWNDFEQPDGSFDFKTGNRDIGEFLKICREEGMWVLFRPGPYVCTEWDFGGFPVSLKTKYPDIKVRTVADKRFMAAQERYLKAIAAVAKPHLAKNGGCILITQLENEHGSYRHDRNYLLWLKKFWEQEGFGPFNTADGPSDAFLKGVTLPGVAVGLDPGEDEAAYECARRNNPGVPVYSSEIYPGWIRHWGEGNWEPKDKSGVIDWHMKLGRSFSLYMIHGGTTFGFNSGANAENAGGYDPQLTSYDFGAPVDEQGRATPAYHRLRELIAGHLPEGQKPPAVPEPIPAMTVDEFTPARIAGLWDGFSSPVKMAKPLNFETWGQNQGAAIYATTLPAGASAKFTYENLNDYSQVYLDGVRLATVDRRKGGEKFIVLPARAKAAKLEILVEGMGHINYVAGYIWGQEKLQKLPNPLETDRKGLFGAVKLDGKDLSGWEVRKATWRGDSIPGAKPVINPSDRPGSHFRGKFTVQGAPADTFLDMSGYTKGVLWVNGHNLGRYWNIGPQFRLYCPAEWLRQGENTVDILDLEMTEARPLRGFTERNR